LRDGAIVLDGGVGPGTTSRLILARIKPSILIGLDGSAKQIAAAKGNLAEYSDLLQFVRASFEFIPFRESIFDGIITCYALRDSLDLTRSISEYSRVCTPRGVFADVDIGKSDNAIKRLMAILYVRYLMPLLAKIAIWKQMKGNPWRMIGPTFDTLPTNSLLLGIMKQQFPSIQTKEFMTGGVIVIIGRKSPNIATAYVAIALLAAGYLISIALRV
jgi:ubiquinone/menaquinone biosynthesis C-methylase UbiE